MKQHKLQIERTQTGVRMEKRILKVLKALAEYHDLTLGDLLEGMSFMFSKENALLGHLLSDASAISKSSITLISIPPPATA